MSKELFLTLILFGGIIALAIINASWICYPPVIFFYFAIMWKWFGDYEYEKDVNVLEDKQDG